MVTRLSTIASAVVVFVTAACSSSHHDKACPKNQPAFRIQVTAWDGPLPLDTELTVTYSGTETESYSLLHGGSHNQDVCCRPASPTSGALPDVHCGLPVSIDASVPARSRDAAVMRDAAVIHEPVTRDAATRDASVALDATIAPLTSDAATLLDAAAPAAPDAAPETPIALDASADASPRVVPPPASEPAAILCNLWTNGVAAVTITATGYTKFQGVLDDPYVPDPRCGVQTVDHRLTLTHGDGGLLR